MNLMDMLLSSGEYFLVITAELLALFIIVSLLVGILNVYVPKERVQKILGKPGRSAAVFWGRFLEH